MSTNTKLADPCLALWQAMNEAEKVGNRTDDKLIVKFLREAGYCIAPTAAHDAEQAQELPPLPEAAKVVRQLRDVRDSRVFSGFDWLAFRDLLSSAALLIEASAALAQRQPLTDAEIEARIVQEFGTVFGPYGYSTTDMVDAFKLGAGAPTGKEPGNGQ